MKTLLAFVASMLIAAACGAQALPTSNERAADVASYVTLGTAIALDAVSSWKANCEDTWDRCEASLVKTGARLCATWAATAALKRWFPRARPCAPSCGIDDPNADFPSGHTAFAFSTLGGPRLAFALPLSVSTGGLRMAANKHDLLGVLSGAAIGFATSRIR